VERPAHVEGVGDDQQQRQRHLQGVEKLEDPDRGGHGEEEEEEGYVPSDGVRVDVHALPWRLAPGKPVSGDLPATYLRSLRPAVAEREGAGSHDEHRGEGGQHERSTQDRAYPYLAGGLGVAAREDGRQDGDDGDHGLRQGAVPTAASTLPTAPCPRLRRPPRISIALVKNEAATTIVPSAIVYSRNTGKGYVLSCGEPA